MANFSTHGSLKAEIRGRVLTNEHTGPFNLEYWQRARSTIWPLIEELEESGPFAMLTVFLESALSSVESMDVIVERNRGFFYSHPNCAGIAIVAETDVEGWTVMQSQFQRYFDALGAPAQSIGFFRQRDEALVFLNRLVAARDGALGLPGHLRAGPSRRT